MNGHIRLRGVSESIKDQIWGFPTAFCIGRDGSAGLHLEGPSVSRQHAEVRPTESGWMIKDLGSTNGTALNGTLLGKVPMYLKVRDQIVLGEFTLVVEDLKSSVHELFAINDYRIKASARASLDEALHALAYDNNQGPRPGDQLVALLRASHYLGHVSTEEELLQSILNDAVGCLDAQTGAIALTKEDSETLRLCAFATGRAHPHGQGSVRASDLPSRPYFSKSLAQRCFNGGESILWDHVGLDPEVAFSQSIVEGAMDSVLCALLRTPRQRLGILHLARGPRQEPFTASDLQLADALAASVSAGIESAQLLRQQQEMFLNFITAWAEAVELRDKYTGGHVHRVTTYALLLAEHLGISREEQEIVRVGASLHDVGKIGIEDAVLRKTGQLTPQEREFMKSHTVYGDKLLSGIPQFAAVRPIVRSHHERWDGKGYPDGLKGMAIPHLARIVFVADAFDAMTSDRPYRRAMSPAAAFLELQAQSGKQFDPQCVAAFLAIRAKITEELNLGDGPRTQPKGMYEKGKEGG